MQNKLLHATLSNVEVEDIYKYEVKATIDGANELITLDKRHMNKKNDFDDYSSLTISYKDLKQLVSIIDKNLAN